MMAHCRKKHNKVSNILRRYGEQVRVIIRHRPGGDKLSPATFGGMFYAKRYSAVNDSC